MVKAKKNKALIIILALCISALFGCQKDSVLTDGEGIDKEQVFAFRERSAVLGLNPILNTTEPDNDLHAIIFETLVFDGVDENGCSVIKPAAAKDWKISNDGTVYTFNIRENACWNDGVPLNADDFVFTFRKMATPDVGSTNAWLFAGVIKNFTESLYNNGEEPKYNKKPEDIGVRAVNEKTVEFTLAKPCGYFLQLLDSAKPIREDKYEEWGEEYGSSIDKIIMNGPFVIESWNQNVQMTLVKNDKYWNAENVKLHKIERKVLQEASTAAQAFINGEIDVVTTNDPDWQKVIKDEGRYKLITKSGNAPEFLGFNCSNKYFKNKKIRLAFSLSFDREKYNEDLRKGVDEPLYSLLPAVTNVGDKLYSERVNGKNEIIKTLKEKYPDPKALLIEGLIEEGFDPDPSKMEVSYATRGTSEFSKKSAEWLLQLWQEKLGVTITIDMLEWNIMWDKVDEGDYDICTSGWTPEYNDPNVLLSIYDPYSGYFDSTKSGWSGPDAEKFSQLLAQAAECSDNQKRAELFLQAEELLVGTGVIAPTYCETSSIFLADYVNDYYTNPHSHIDYTRLYTLGKN